MLSKIHHWFTPPAEKASRAQVIFWLSLSLIFAASYALLALQQALSAKYVIQDDARMHVFWMARFLDPDLFPNDLIANYFQSSVPLGYTLFYRVPALLGLDPLFLNKLLPLILGLITTAYFFGITMQLLPVPIAGFLATVLLNQNVWLKDDLVSGTPRAFLYPLLTAFLYYLLRRRLWPCLAAIALQALFYPQCVLISAAILVVGVLDWENGRWWQLSRDRQAYQFCILGLGVTLVTLLPFVLTASGYGPVLKAADARQMLEFQPGGRTFFFNPDPGRYWLHHERSGMLPNIWHPVLLLTGALLPLVLRLRDRFPLAQAVSNRIYLLPQMLVASLGLFFLAHAVLFKLQLPSRYTHHTIRMVLALAAGIVLTVLLDSLVRWLMQNRRIPAMGQQAIALGVTACLGAALVFSPFSIKEFPKTNYQIGEKPALYEFFAQQPKDSLIASLEKDANNLPSFAQRSVLVAQEYALPYHTGYYRQFRQRVVDLITAQFSPNLATVKQFIEKYGIDFWLLDRSSVEAKFLADDRWLQQYQPTAQNTLSMLEAGNTPALTALLDSCQVFQVNDMTVLQASCILKAQ